MFGARVTNFDLQTFLSRLPGLLNTYEGRKVIIDQMELSSRIAGLYDTALLDVYRHYGQDKITPERADEIAKRKIADEKEALEDELLSLNQDAAAIYDESLHGNEFPDAASAKGRVIVDDETGKEYVSDGKSWRPL